MGLRRPTIVLAQKKPTLIFTARSVAFRWLFFASFPYYLAYFDLFFPPRENHQVQTVPLLLHSSGHCLLSLHRLSWLRNSSPPRNSWVALKWWATLFTKHVYILMRGFNQKNDLNNEDFGCFVMTSQQNSKFCVCVCVVFFSPKRYDFVVLSIYFLWGCQVNLVNGNFYHLKLVDFQSNMDPDLDFFLLTECRHLEFSKQNLQCCRHFSPIALILFKKETTITINMRIILTLIFTKCYLILPFPK